MVALAARWPGQVGGANQVTGIGDPGHEPRIPSQRLQVLHHSALPEKRMIKLASRLTADISRKSRGASDLAAVVEDDGGPINAAECAAECAQIDHFAVMPKEGTNRWTAGGAIG